jgi:hypothetical protein
MREAGAVSLTMKNNLFVSVAAFALYVAGMMSAQAFETAQGVTATPITSSLSAR